mmetsp:Transcript_11636/g.28218  ORF Transcript_11636/g.28218 Transcript_11636/m.28218 type:complete len:317 (-) Transcript_11636:68-1018(-)
MIMSSPYVVTLSRHPGGIPLFCLAAHATAAAAGAGTAPHGSLSQGEPLLHLDCELRGGQEGVEGNDGLAGGRRPLCSVFGEAEVDIAVPIHAVVGEAHAPLLIRQLAEVPPRPLPPDHLLLCIPPPLELQHHNGVEHLAHRTVAQHEKTLNQHHSLSCRRSCLRHRGTHPVPLHRLGAICVPRLAAQRIRDSPPSPIETLEVQRRASLLLPEVVVGVDHAHHPLPLLQLLLQRITQCRLAGPGAPNHPNHRRHYQPQCPCPCTPRAAAWATVGGGDPAAGSSCSGCWGAQVKLAQNHRWRNEQGTGCGGRERRSGQ